LHHAFVHDNLDRDAIEDVAQSHRVCPFELSLELACWADCIVCDYNYAFDPRVYLKRFFDEENGAYAFLVDEAHNLVDRSRDMFSARLRKSEFLELRRAVKSRSAGGIPGSGKDQYLDARCRKRRPRAFGGFSPIPGFPKGWKPCCALF
jgi:DNA excision repair protein ERCC-2